MLWGLRRSGMTMIEDLLEKTCKNMIRTILCCLTSAFKGTVYRVGPMPDLQVVRITSGVREADCDEIKWGLPATSDYNPPGKSWTQYCDHPDRPLEAMGWCVEKQKSWTAENPYEDVRSVAKQLRGELEDFYHMEPVLVRKTDLYGPCLDALPYPRDWRGNPIWQETEYVVVAVIKIHFLPHTIRRDDQSTRVIRELSRSLGTEILTLQLRETLFKAQREFARQRLRSCEVLAHELRNTLIKFAFIIAAVNSQLGVLRQEWETQMKIAFPLMPWREAVLRRLEGLLLKGSGFLDGDQERIQIFRKLSTDQMEMKTSCLLPHQYEQWLNYKIIPKWDRLLSHPSAFKSDEGEIRQLLSLLRDAIHKVIDEELLTRISHLPQDLCTQWVDTAFVYFTADKLSVLDDAVSLLNRTDLPIAHRHQIKKTLKSLRALVELVPEMEEKADRIIYSLRHSGIGELNGARGFDQLSACPLL